MKRTTVTLETEKIVSGGYCLAKDKSGLTYLIRGACPGEVVKVRVVQDKHSVVFADTVEVLRASPDRATAFCKHYGTCGGCVLQHLSYEAQVSAKRAIVEELLKTEGKIVEPKIASVSASTPDTGYRCSVSFNVKDKHVGFFKEGTNDIVPLEECPVLADALSGILPRLNALAEKYPTITAIDCLFSDEDTSIVLNVITTNRINNPDLFDKLVGRDHIKGVMVTKTGDESAYFKRGDDAVTITAGDHPLLIHVKAFVQNNPNVYTAFYAAVSKYLRREKEKGFDLYSGIGFFTVLMAEYLDKVIAVESEYYSFRNSIANRKENKFEQKIYAINERVEDPELLTKCKQPEGTRFKYVLIDPPRIGMTEQAVETVKKILPEVLIYVSCDPATLARDISRLAPQYTFVETNVIDAFPHTKHIETVSMFTLNPDRPRPKLTAKATSAANNFKISVATSSNPFSRKK
jgi:23S rRNA (uracil1939-C5)-methyltransferase